jgi:hypothetical protein
MIDLTELDQPYDYQDEIVEADREAGQEIFQNAGGMVKQYFAHLNKLAEESPSPKWDPPARKPSTSHQRQI